jgi:hypothetical protein
MVLDLVVHVVHVETWILTRRRRTLIWRMWTEKRGSKTERPVAS